MNWLKNFWLGPYYPCYKYAWLTEYAKIHIPALRRTVEYTSPMVNLIKKKK